MNFEDYDFLEEGDVTITHARTSLSDWYLVDAVNLGGKCWVGQAVIEFDVSPEVLQALPVQNPPTPTPPAEEGGDEDEPDSGSPPTAPSNPKIKQTCLAQQYSVQLSWIDASNNEEGFRIYPGDDIIATLGPNSEGYVDNPPYGGPYLYKIEAFNSNGVASTTIEDQGCLT